MRKILSAIILTALIFFCSQNNFANAQDVYAGNTGGLDFYVDTNSIYLENKESFFVNVKKVDERTGNLKDTNRWKFYISTMSDGATTWFFDYYLSGTKIPVYTNEIAKKILNICQDSGKGITIMGRSRLGF